MGPSRPDFYMIAERSEDVMSCIAVAAPLRRAGLTVATPLHHSSVKRQLRKADDANAYMLINLNGSVATIRYRGTPVKVECTKDEVVDICLDHESKDDTVFAATDKLLEDHYVYLTGDVPPWLKKDEPVKTGFFNKVTSILSRVKQFLLR